MKVFASLLFTSLSLAACVADDVVVDELAGEIAADDTADGKADAGAVDGAYTYFQIESAEAGYLVRRVNRTTTVCADGAAEACFAPSLDVSEAGLSSAGVAALTTAAQQSVAASPRALVRGRLASGAFIVTEAWVAVNDVPATGVFTRLTDSGIRCLRAPCPSTRELGLNTSRSGTIVDVDFTSALAPELVDDVHAAFAAPGGVIIAGERIVSTVRGVEAKSRSVTAVYRRVD